MIDVQVLQTKSENYVYTDDFSIPDVGNQSNIYCSDLRRNFAKLLTSSYHKGSSCQECGVINVRRSEQEVNPSDD